MSEQHMEPGPDHPITVRPNPAHVVARVGGHVVADTTNALTLQEANYPPVQYVPFTDVNASALRRTDTATHCPYKGDASYYSIVTEDGELTDAVWGYETPYPAVAEIAGHVAFVPDKVQVSVAS